LQCSVRLEEAEQTLDRRIVEHDDVVHAAKRRDGNQCVVCKRAPKEVYEEKLAAGWKPWEARKFYVLETDHIEQVLGRHAVTGCHHHLDGLRTLCAHHHLERHHVNRQPFTRAASHRGRVTVQPRLVDVPAAAKPLTPRQAAAWYYVRSTPEGVTAEQVGANWYAFTGRP